MYLYGTFVNQLGVTVAVHIVTGGDRTKQVEIGVEGGGVFFADDPVTIDSQVNDTFDHLLRSQATIRLLTTNFIPELFGTSCMDAVVNIFKGDNCIFAGYIEPQVYSQDYNEVYDELEITCIDVLSALQYSKYGNVGYGVLYEAVKANAGTPTFGEIILGILQKACDQIDITGIGGARYYYDGSKALSPNNLNKYGVFNEIAISELLFLGSEEDDVWKQDEVVEKLLKYLNLHITQEGLCFYIFSWETIKNYKKTQAFATIDDAYESWTAERKVIDIDMSNVASNDTTISIGEVYNQIMLNCDVESMDNVIDNPLDGDALVSPYTNRQLYMTEIISEGEGDRAQSAFYNMCHGIDTDYSESSMVDWYVQVKNNRNWKFYETTNNANTGGDLIELYCANNENQQVLPNRLLYHPGVAIVSFGKVETKNDKKDNSLTPKIDMTDYLVVAVDGTGSDDFNVAYPNESSILSCAPLAEYVGNTTGGVYSPSNDDTTNYIVLSGKIVLNPRMTFSCVYDKYYNNQVDITKSDTVPSRNNGDGRYYTQKYYKAQTPFADPEYDGNTIRGLVPFTENGPEEYEFKYSAVGDYDDHISKVSVLACMLIIGDKCLVETGNNGQIDDFEWREYKTPEECDNDDEYYSQCFFVGFDPKIGDKLIGVEYDVQNNISYKLGLDAEGMAIPVRKSDKLSGEVKFKILGPVNVVWDEVTRRHRTWFRREKWTTNAIPLMSHVSSIYIKSFEIKLYSDNGFINNFEDNDLIYMSNTNEAFVNRKDDISFEINSALTLDECQALGVPDTIKLSTPIALGLGTGVLSIYDYNSETQEKPEKLYVDSYYAEYHKPRILMTQKLNDKDGVASIFNQYKHPAMPDKQFYVQGISRNLMEGYAELTIKEVWHD